MKRVRVVRRAIIALSMLVMAFILLATGGVSGQAAAHGLAADAARANVRTASGSDAAVVDRSGTETADLLAASAADSDCCNGIHDDCTAACGSSTCCADSCGSGCHSFLIAGADLFRPRLDAGLSARDFDTPTPHFPAVEPRPPRA